jgi:hypothetical protein
MKSLIFLSSVIFLTLLQSCKSGIPEQEYDICIYGGTSSGIIAAYTVKKMGNSVILIEPSDHLGGLTTGGLGQTDIGNKDAITGLARDFYRRIGREYGMEESWTFEPHVAGKVFGDMIREAGIVVIRNASLIKTGRRGTKIRTLRFGYNDMNPGPDFVIKAKVFLDCSYEGDLLAMAGVSYTVGREDNRKYNETLNGVQLMQGHQFPDSIDPYRIKGDPASGLLWGISGDMLIPAGTGDKKVQAYNFRICLTDSSENMIPPGRPEGYDSTKYELLLRLIERTGNTDLYRYFIWSRMPGRKTDINNRGAFSTDMIGENHDYPEAGYSTRKEIFRKHLIYTRGLLYFLGHDSRVPGNMRTEMLKWGYPKDEYPDNDHFTPQLYIREARRMTGEYVMTEHHCRGSVIAEEPVGLAAYTMDSHNCQRIVVNGMVKNEGNVEVGGFPPYPIDYRAIVPGRKEVTNLLVPVCLSASHIAFGSIRMEPVFMVLGQSAGIAACLAASSGSAVQDIKSGDIRKALSEWK